MYTMKSLFYRWLCCFLYMYCILQQLVNGAWDQWLGYKRLGPLNQCIVHDGTHVLIDHVLHEPLHPLTLYIVHCNYIVLVLDWEKQNGTSRLHNPALLNNQYPSSSPRPSFPGLGELKSHVGIISPFLRRRRGAYLCIACAKTCNKISRWNSKLCPNVSTVFCSRNCATKEYFPARKHLH